MTIERLEPLARQPHRLKIHLSDGSVLTTQDYVAADLGLYPGKVLEEQDYQALLEAVSLAAAKNRAVRMIAAAGHSRQDLQRKLVQKGEDPQAAQAAVDWLTDLKLLDDRETAAALVRSAVAKGYGKARIRQILQEKAIPRELWEEALALVPAMDEAVDRFLERRFRGEIPDEKEIKRAVDALLRRGHCYGDIRAGLQRYDLSLEGDFED